MRILLAVAWLALSLPISARAVEPNSYRDKLLQDTILQGYPCARGYAFLFPDSSLNQCTVSRDTAFGAIQIPRGSVIVLRVDGKPHHVFLAHNAWVNGLHAMGGGFLGPGEGAITSLYPTGQLRSLYLVADATIQGVPCRGGEWGIFTDPVNGGNFVEFFPNGQLRACKLAQDDQGTRKAHRITLKQ